MERVTFGMPDGHAGMNAHSLRKNRPVQAADGRMRTCNADFIDDLAASPRVARDEKTANLGVPYRLKKEDKVDPADADASGFAGAGCGGAGAGAGSSRFDERFEE